MPTKVTTESFIERSKLVHGDRYDYSQVIYNGAHTKIKIVCREHGLYEQNPTNHLSKQGCPKCGLESQALARSSQAKLKFKERASHTHNNKYDYSLVDYKNSHAKVSIICTEHGIFEQTPGNHINGMGCPHCAYNEKGFTRSKFIDKCIKNNNGLGILYILECFNEQEKFFKIGITSLSIKRRYNSKTSMPYAYRVIDEITGDPEFIYDLEIKMHKQHKEYQHIPTIPFGGHLTECFTQYLGVKHE